MLLWLLSFVTQRIDSLIYLCFSGYTLLQDPHHNKGLASIEKERDAHYLRGLLPPAVLNQDLQVIFNDIALRLESSNLCI